MLGWCLYTPRGTRPRRILSNIYRTYIEDPSNGGLLWGHFGVIVRLLWGQIEVGFGLNLVHQGDCGALCEPFRRRKALAGTCDGYMRALGGAEKRKC